MAPIKEETHYMMPEAFCGTWTVQSYQTPDGKNVAGEEKDHWQIRPQSVTCGNAKALVIKKVETRVEGHQDLHLVSFSNNNLQFAFLRSYNKPDDLLVIEYLFGEEKLRCLLALSD